MKLSGKMKTIDVKKTGDMMYPLEAPNGYFLFIAEHQHTELANLTDTYEPVQMAEGPWRVQFQKYPKGGGLTEGRGHSLEQAWEAASLAVLNRELKNG